MQFQSVKLPNFFKPKVSYDLLRLGSKNDGGYIVSKKDILSSSNLLSFGINDDWLFEKSFLKKNNINCYAFDGSLTRNYWIKYFLKAIISFKFNKIFKFFHFYFFFKKNKKFFLKFVTNVKGKNNITFSSIMSTYLRDYNNIFLKVDIEGSEYRILDDIISYSEKFISVVIEFHDIDLHLDKIEKFINNFPLKIIHTHPNNYAGVNANLSPLAIEVTFSREYKNEEAVKFNKLDSPNDKHSAELVIEYY